MLKKIYIDCFMFSSIFIASIVFAQDSVTDISGNASAIGVVLNNQIAVAIGDDANAVAQVGIIAEGVNINGDVSALGVVKGNQIAISTGKKAKACSRVGVVGNSCNK